MGGAGRLCLLVVSVPDPRTLACATNVLACATNNNDYSPQNWGEGSLQVIVSYKMYACA